jgi:hypothetical protein
MQFSSKWSLSRLASGRQPNIKARIENAVLFTVEVRNDGYRTAKYELKSGAPGPKPVMWSRSSSCNSPDFLAAILLPLGALCFPVVPIRIIAIPGRP